MRLIIKFFILILFIFTLTACYEIKTYDELLSEYQAYVSEQEAIYEEQINYFNHISNHSLKSAVLVRKTGTFLQGTTTGSGVIIKEEDSSYYVLTNNHVVYPELGLRYTYTISDYIGNEYIATLVANDANYDLAVLKFTKRIDLNVIEFAEFDAKIDDRLAVLGYPSIQINAITLGNALNYTKINLENSNPDLINVSFDILVSDAPVKSGSSGSLVINDVHKLIGIVFAGNFVNQNSSSKYVFIIPVSKVIEFLNANNILIRGDLN